MADAIDSHAGASQSRRFVDGIRLEYDEMPGLSLTLEQAARFWHLDREACRLALDCLVRDGFLARGRSGYIRSR